MKITSLAENTALNNSVKAEHGLSLYIETNSHKILFDMGQTDLFEKNSEALGIDLSEVDIAVISHGHYDHGGGLERFLQINSKAPVYISRHAFGDYFNGKEKYIGLDKNLKDNERFIYTEDELQIDENLSLFSCNSFRRNFDSGSFGLTELTNNEYIPDRFLHEQYLLIKENGKNILISGCSHKGILNITEWFCPDVLIGGFHFSKLPLDETLVSYCDFLNGSGTVFYTCHCTGQEQYEFMKERMPRLFYLPCGGNISGDL